MKTAQRGFTLIEVLVAIILAGLLASLLISVVGTGLTGTAQVLGETRTLSQAVDVMENITADHRLLVATSNTPLSTLATNVGAAGSTQNNAYGSYTVVTNQRVSFSNFNEVNNANGNMLKVRIRVGDVNLTSLFTQ